MNKPMFTMEPYGKEPLIISNVEDTDHAIRVASAIKTTGFKLYDENGCFYREFCLFDGKFRRVMQNVTAH